MFEFGRAYFKNGFRPVLVKRARVWSHVVYCDGNTVCKTKTRDPLTVRPLAGYNLTKGCNAFLRRKGKSGIRKTITKGAQSILNEARRA